MILQQKIDHGTLDGLGDDDHSQYLLLAGRSGGQTANFGTDSGDDGIINSTAHATQGDLTLNAKTLLLNPNPADSSDRVSVFDSAVAGETPPFQVFGRNATDSQARSFAVQVSSTVDDQVEISGHNILNMYSNLLIGNAIADIDYYLKFNGQSNQGTITWMEDEDYFQFDKGVVLDSTLDVTGNIDPTSYDTENGGFKDEDDMASDSATAVCSQQSIKKYVDDQILTTDTWDEVMHIGNTFTVADTENLSATINQNDITNNPAALIITNTGSGNDITAPSFSLIAGAITGTSLSVATGEVTAGSLNRTSGTLTLEIGGTVEQSITSTETTFGGNIVAPDDFTLGPTSTPGMLTFESDTITIAGANDITATSTALEIASLNCGLADFQTATPDTDGDARLIIDISDLTSYAQGVGAGVAFLGKYNSGGNTERFGAIWAEKENGTDGNDAGEIHLGTRANGGNISTGFKIDSNLDAHIVDAKKIYFGTDGSFVGDTDTNLILNGDGNLQLQSSGTTRLTVADTSITSTVDIVLPDGGAIRNASGPDITLDSSNGYVEITGANVGIGLTNPGDYSVSANNLVVTDEGGGNSGLTIVSGTSSDGAIYFADGTAGDDVNRGIFAYDHNVDSMRFGVNASIVMTIVNGGDIGIGTITPDGILDIEDPAGDADVYIKGFEASNANLFLFADEGDDNADKGRIQMDTSGNLSFQTYASGAYADGILIDNSGQVGINESAPNAQLDVNGTTRLGDSDTNYTAVSATGDISQAGTARHNFTKYTANSITLDDGASSDTVSDLQTAHDGNVYRLEETATTPGFDLIVDFVSVTAFNKVFILASYEGSSSHGGSITLYNWNTTSWDSWADTAHKEYSASTPRLIGNESFRVWDDTNYIGTGGDAGKVRVRFHHPDAGNVAHDLYIDVCALYQ
jgi:hypothetical protein